MTSQTKHYIELCDILGLRFECKSCGTTVSYRLGQNFDLLKLGGCPCCQKSWVENASGASIQSEIEVTTRSIKRLADVLGPDGKFPTELSLTLEVSAPAGSAVGD